MTYFERVLFIAGMSITVLASIGLCMQVYAWRTACAEAGSFGKTTIAGAAKAGC